MENPFTAESISSHTKPYQFKGLNLNRLKSTSESIEPKYLTPEQLQFFLINGYLVLNTNLSEEFHDYVLKQANDYFQGRKDDVNPGNNFLCYFPALQQVIEDPNVDGALRSILGEGYELHPHKYCHRTFPGVPAQQWHKDSFWGYKKLIRYHRPRYAMIMYYPQKVTLNNGPTWIKPGSQYSVIDPKYYWGNLPNKYSIDGQNDLPVEIEKGSLVLIHYDIVHRGGQNLQEALRQMYKIQFVRMNDPMPNENLPWNNLNLPYSWETLLGEDNPDLSAFRDIEFLTSVSNMNELESLGLSTESCQAIRSRISEYTSGTLSDYEKMLTEPISKSIWDLYFGNEEMEELDDAQKNLLLGLLHNDSEQLRLFAYYTLARSGNVTELLDILLSQEDIETEVKIEVMHAITSSKGNVEEIENRILEYITSDAITEELLPLLIFLIGEIRQISVNLLPHFINYVNSENEDVRLYLTEVLGIIGSRITDEEELKPILRTLSQFLEDTNDQVRFTTCLSIARIGPLAYPLLDNLIDALSDHNRYVQGYAVMALKRINTEKSREILLNYLYYTRYDPITTFSSQY